MFFPAFTVWQFALAGAIAAAGPLIIHLLNRRRYRTLPWAAMDFLKEAVQRNRRILQLRDWLLLVLRTLAVLLFGLALARPFFSNSAANLEDRQPLHAIVMIDDSRSMSYEALGGSLLDRAKLQARKYLEKLPAGSRATIIPGCGYTTAISHEPYANLEAASEAIGKIEIDDRALSQQRVVNAAKIAQETLPGLAKRLVFWGDQQNLNWQGLDTPESFQELPAMQLVNIAPESPENSWIDEVRLEDNIADVETPAKFVVRVRHVGQQSRQDVQVSLWVNNEEVGAKTINLEPGPGAREVDFEYLFSSFAPEVGRPLFVPVKATITPDRFSRDDERYLVVPVVASLPVVFVDQYGERENPAANRLGETRHLRKLLAPNTGRASAHLPLIKMKHVTPSEFTRELVAEARLVVVAGIAEPTAEMVEILGEYIRQGGQCLLAAGGDFDARRWHEMAWLEGHGLLPFPLKPEPLGTTPEQVRGELKPFFLSYESLRDDPLFQITGVADDDLRDMYSEPFFFQAVELQEDAIALKSFQAALREKLTEELAVISEAQTREAEFTKQELNGALTPTDQQERLRWRERVRELQPQWLVWATYAEFPPEPEIPQDTTLREKYIEELTNQQLPQVLARFQAERQPAFLVSRRWGRGRFLFCSTGLCSSWNTLPKTNAMVIFDRLLREMLADTLPSRNFEPQDSLTLPLARFEPDISVSLLRPEGVEAEALDVGFIGQDQRGVTLHGLGRHGIYTVVGSRTEAATPTSGSQIATREWEIPFAINGDSVESEPEYLSAGKFAELAVDSPVHWLEEGDDISLAGATIRGQYIWWFGVLTVLALLLVEMSTLAWPQWRAAVQTSGQSVRL